MGGRSRARWICSCSGVETRKGMEEEDVEKGGGRGGRQRMLPWFLRFEDFGSNGDRKSVV